MSSQENNIVFQKTSFLSGTTFNWTDYLATVSPEWLSKVGRGAAVKWPAASSVGGKGNWFVTF